MDIIVKEPGTGKQARLTKEQFDACHDMIVAAMNNAINGTRKSTLTDQAIINKCAEAGLPIEFK